jgi:LPS export ABC transporter protein LptC
LIYRLLILFGLALAAVAVWLTLAPRQTSPTTAQTNHAAGPEQGYAATDASVVETGADGHPMYTLQAQQVRQNPDDNLINLTKVHMTFSDESGGHWQARADRAVANQDSAQIDLSGSVDITGSFAGSDRPLHFLSDTLHVDTRTDILRTPAVITLNWSGHLLTALGMVADLKNHRVILEAQVHGQFNP